MSRGVHILAAIGITLAPFLMPCLAQTTIDPGARPVGLADGDSVAVAAPAPRLARADLRLTDCDLLVIENLPGGPIPDADYNGVTFNYAANNSVIPGSESAIICDTDLILRMAHPVKLELVSALGHMNLSSDYYREQQ